MKHQETQSKLALTQDRIRSCLGTFQHMKDGLGNDKLLRHALLDMFVAMIKLWVSTTTTLRSTTRGVSNTPLAECIR